MPPATRQPTEHTAKPASTSKTGLFATLRGLLHAQGSGAPTRSLIATPLVLLCALLALSAAVAQAEPPKLIPYGQFGTQEEHAAGVAVEGSGDLFVSGLLGEGAVPSSVVKLDPSGNLLSPPSPFGSELYSGVAVNPVNGDVYVLGQEAVFTPTTKIFTYDPNTGAPVGTPWEVPPSLDAFGFITAVPIATDSAGNVYVPVVPENKVLEYSPSGTLLKTFTGSGTSVLKAPTGVVVAPSGNLWVAGSNRIVELDSSDAPVEVNGKPVAIESEGVWSVALDGHGDIFALVTNSADVCGEKAPPCFHLIEYNAEGKQLADVGAGKIGESGGEEEDYYSGLAVNEASGRVYVVAGLQRTVFVFGPPTAPLVDRELTAEVHTSEAKLGALVDPGGIAASYRFEYGPTTGYGSSTPSPEGSVGEGIEGRAVWAAASGLAPGSTYHYRVVASNELGTVYGPDQTFTTLTAEQAACPNEELRGGFAAELPDCRAYELVTPPPKNSSQFDAAGYVAYGSTVAADGEAISLNATEPQPDAPSGGEQYVATRHAAGWIAEDIMPLESYDGLLCQQDQPVYAYSDQLSKDVMVAGGGSSASVSRAGQEYAGNCDPEGRQVVSGEPVGRENLLVRDNATGAYQLVNVTPAGVMPADAHFQAASADLSRVFFTETSPLAEGAAYGVENLYEWHEGALRLVSVLADGTAVPGSLAAKASQVRTSEYEGVVSSNGSRVLFTYDGALYDRIDGQRTVKVDESQGGSGVGGGGSFKAATSDGSKIFFLDESRLTPGSTAETGEPDLYECVLPEGVSKCELSDLTVAPAGEHAGVVRVTPLGSHDSSHVYFVAKGVLASNMRQFTNGEGKTVVEGAEPGKENLYLWNGEKTVFVASGVSNQGRNSNEQTSPDGKWIAFESAKGLTGYDFGIDELFLYGAATEQLVCASCNPTGEAPVAEGGVARFSREFEEEEGVFRARHVLTDAGQVFFETRDALVPSDTNGQLDVYEYEGGHVYLISSGTSSFESNLEGASESGDDVFFRSDQPLVPQDHQEGMIVIYDARVAGGIAEPATALACTTADSCRAAVPPQPGIYGAPASQTFSGLGNLGPLPSPPGKATVKNVTKCQKGFTKNKKDKCVRKKTKKSKKAKKTSNDRRAK